MNLMIIGFIPVTEQTCFIYNRERYAYYHVAVYRFQVHTDARAFDNVFSVSRSLPHEGSVRVCAFVGDDISTRGNDRCR